VLLQNTNFNLGKDRAMNCIDEMTEAQKAWILWKKLNELQNLLWEMYYREFKDMEKRDVLLTINHDSMPF
jgi:hypothetical protein